MYVGFSLAGGNFQDCSFGGGGGKRKLSSQNSPLSTGEEWECYPFVSLTLKSVLFVHKSVWKEFSVIGDFPVNVRHVCSLLFGYVPLHSHQWRHIPKKGFRSHSSSSFPFAAVVCLPSPPWACLLSKGFFEGGETFHPYWGGECVCTHMDAHLRSVFSFPLFRGKRDVSSWSEWGKNRRMHTGDMFWESKGFPESIIQWFLKQK